MRKPFDGDIQKTQDWNDPRFRSSYAQFGILGHNGEDYGTPTGTPILAPHHGTVIEATFDSGYGNYVKIEDGAQGSVLAHLSKIEVTVGQVVGEGQKIGLSGNTGNSTGPHLHWGYYRIPRNRNNGFLGYIDQDPDWLQHKEQTVDTTPLQNEINRLNVVVAEISTQRARALEKIKKIDAVIKEEA